MKRVTALPICFAVLLPGILILVSWFEVEGKNKLESCKIWTLERSSPGMEQDVMLRPFVTPGKAYGIALDGGSIPLFAYELPCLHFGPKVDCPLHLVMLVDWQSESSRRLLLRMHEIYQSETSASLPPLALTLLPGSFSNLEMPIQETILAVHFVSNRSETLPALMRDISVGSATAELGAIRERLRELEPEIIPRIDSVLSGQKDFMDKAFLIARSQKRNTLALLECEEATQLVSMRQILTGDPDAAQLAAFLTTAKLHQDSYLLSPVGQIPVIPPAGCDCEDANHPH